MCCYTGSAVESEPLQGGELKFNDLVMNRVRLKRSDGSFLKTTLTPKRFKHFNVLVGLKVSVGSESKTNRLKMTVNEPLNRRSFRTPVL